MKLVLLLACARTTCGPGTILQDRVCVAFDTGPSATGISIVDAGYGVAVHEYLRLDVTTRTAADRIEVVIVDVDRDYQEVVTAFEALDERNDRWSYRATLEVADDEDSAVPNETSAFPVFTNAGNPTALFVVESGASSDCLAMGYQPLYFADRCEYYE